MAEKGMEVQRHTLFKRLNHWLTLLFLLILIISGLEIGGIYGNLMIFSNVRGLHTVVGGIWMAWILIYLYYIIVNGDLKHFIPNMAGLKYLWAETKAWFGRGPKPEEPVIYDPKTGKYVRKYDPGEWIDFWAFTILAIVVSVTGLAIGFKGFMEKYGFGFLYTTFGYAMLRAIHRFCLFGFVAMAVLHVYAMAILGFLRSMIWGKRLEKVAK